MEPLPFPSVIFPFTVSPLITVVPVLADVITSPPSEMVTASKVPLEVERIVPEAMLAFLSVPPFSVNVPVTVRVPFTTSVPPVKFRLPFTVKAPPETVKFSFETRLWMVEVLLE